MPRRTTDPLAPRPTVLGAAPWVCMPAMTRVPGVGPTGLYVDSSRPMPEPRTGRILPDELAARAMVAFGEVLHAPFSVVAQAFDTQFPGPGFLGSPSDMRLPEAMWEILAPNESASVRPGTHAADIRVRARSSIAGAIRCLLNDDPFACNISQATIRDEARIRLRYGFDCWRNLETVMHEHGTGFAPFEFDVDSQAGIDRAYRIICTGMESMPGHGERSVLNRTRLCFLVSEEGVAHSTVPNSDRPWMRVCVDSDGFALVHGVAIGPRSATMERPQRVVHLFAHQQQRNYLESALDAVAYALMMAPRCIALASRRRCDFLGGLSSVSGQRMVMPVTRRLGMGLTTFAHITGNQWSGGQRSERVVRWMNDHRVPALETGWQDRESSGPTRTIADLVRCSPFDAEDAIPLFWRDEIGLDPERRPQAPPLSVQVANATAAPRPRNAPAAAPWSWTAIHPRVAEIMARDLTLTLEDPVEDPEEDDEEEEDES